MALRHVGPLVVVYAVWFVAYGPAGKVRQVGPKKRSTVGGDLRFVVTGFSRAFTDAAHYPVIGALLFAFFVAGGVLAWRQRRGLAFRQLAAPMAMLAGSVGYLVTTAAGRSSFGAGYAGISRHVSLTFAMLLPAVAVAVDAIARAWRYFVPIAVALLLIGVPAGLSRAEHAQHKLDPLYVGTRRTILSVGRDPWARTVPRSLRPEQLTARDVTVGWLLEGIREHRIPPPQIAFVNYLASSHFRLSFFQTNVHAPATRCTKITRPTYLRVRRNEVVGLYDNPITIVPLRPPLLVGFGLFFRPQEGHAIEVLRAVRPLALSSTGAEPGRVCVTPGAPVPHPYVPGHG